jgi:signal transduction histidine kinase
LGVNARLLRLALLCLAALLTGGCDPTRHAPPDGVWRLTEATLFEPGAQPREVVLPDAWEATAPARAGEVSYRVELPDDLLATRQLAVHVPRVGNAYRLLLNGASLVDARWPPTGEPEPDSEFQGAGGPVLVPLPGALLRAKGNVLDIEVQGAPQRESGLSQVWVGPLVTLQPLHDGVLRQRVQGGWVISAAATVMGLLALLLAWRARSIGYACFGAASLLWAWRVVVPASGTGAWHGVHTVLFQASYAWFVVLMALYALDTIGRRTRKRALALAGWAGTALLLTLAGWGFNLPLLRTLVLAGNLLLTLAVGVVLVRAAWRERQVPAMLLSAAALFALLLGLRDFWVFRVLHEYGAITLGRYSIFGLLAVLAWMLVDEFIRSTQGLRRLNRELQDRIADRERELEAAFELTRGRERQQAALGERDRILREMHDGLGGRLVAALALTGQLTPPPAPPETPSLPMPLDPVRELRMTLDDCLVELRLALDSLESDQRPLLEALAEMRFRVEPSLRAAGVRLVWQVGEAVAETQLPAGDTLQVLRIVREALTNVLKHAQATVVWLRLEPAALDDGAAALRLAVIDNGLQQRGPGDDEGAPRRGGRGLTNMRKRAEAVGAQIDSGPQAGGWEVALLLPLPTTPAAAMASG